MKKSGYIRGLLSSIKEFADLDYQHREWIRFETNPYASYEESMCMLYDGANFEGILEHADQFEFSEEQLHRLQQFHHTLQKFDEECFVGVEEMIKQPGWQKVVKAAQEVQKVFINYHLKNDTELNI